MGTAIEDTGTSDELLAARAGHGDRAAFTTLYERFARAIFDFSYRTLRDRDAAADIAQLTFTKAWDQLRRGSVPHHARPWLFTIARNAAIDELRHRRHLAGRIDDEAVDADEDESPAFTALDPDRLADPEAAAADHELVELVWESAAALDPRDYSLLDLHVRQGFDADELAAELGLAKGAVYTRLSRLRDALEEAVVTVLLMRRGRAECAELDALLAEPRPSAVTRDIRRAVQGHLRSCPRCQDSRRRFAAPLEIFAALGVIPIPEPARTAITDAVSRHVTAEDGAKPASGSGLLRQAPRKLRSNAVAALTAAFVALAVLTVVLAVQPAPAPLDPPDVHSTSHVIGRPSSDPVIVIVWSRETAALGYSVAWSEHPIDVPAAVANLRADASGATSPPLEPAAWYFHLRTESRDGRWTSTVHLGPFLIVAAPGPSAEPSPTTAPTGTSSPALTPAAAISSATVPAATPAPSAGGPTPRPSLRPSVRPAPTSTPIATPGPTRSPAPTSTSSPSASSSASPSPSVPPSPTQPIPPH